MATHTYPTGLTHTLITVATVTSTIMAALDITIANVALDHIQASISASREQIIWVLTSYIVVSAICTPLAGWMASRFGRRKVMLGAIIGFSLSSVLCGISTNLGELIGFRAMQGAFAAPLVPISQAILFDINPPEKHGPAMAQWGMGAILGPILGPTLGGWITQSFEWRWVFFINLPVCVITFVGLLVLRDSPDDRPVKLDLFGFGLLALGLGSLQLMLDRGQQLGWFDSWEICIEATLVAAALYFTVVHTLTTEHPFVEPGLFKDRNYLVGLVIGFVIGVFVYGVLSLMPPMMEQMMGYPVVTTGLVMAPRGFGTMLMMLVIGRIVNRIDYRVFIVGGLMICTLAMYMMSGISLAMDAHIVIVAGFLQGLGTGMLFVPLSTMVFATIPGSLRNAGSAMYSLSRNIGASVGISILQALIIRNTAEVHSRLAEGVRPDNPLLAFRMPDMDFGATATLVRLDHLIERQAMMVAYTDDFWLLSILGLVVTPLILISRPSRKRPAKDMEPIALE